ncbi:MAG: glycosyltransferase [Phycisphaerales bacterium]|nr:glycosyltransferase [Phycisphaerales bacterium]
MRVVLLVTDLQPGGTPLRIARLARRLSTSGVDVHVGCLAPRGPLHPALEASEVPTFACDARGPWDLAAAWRLARKLRDIRPDLIHATLTHANVVARLVGRWLRIPVLTSTATIEIERRWHRWAERLTAPLDRGHIVSSPALAEHVARRFGYAPECVFVVPPSLDPAPKRIDRAAARRQLGLAEQGFLVAWIGRMDPVKRLALLVECAAQLADVGVGWLLAGDGPERARIEALLSRRHLASVVRLVGWQSDVAAVLSAADALLLPSRTEGVPNAVLEALACGVPVVASDLPTLRALRADGAPLTLVQGDEPKPFVAALSGLRSDPAGADAQSAASSAWAARSLAPERTVRALLAVYEAVLSQR